MIMLLSGDVCCWDEQKTRKFCGSHDPNRNSQDIEKSVSYLLSVLLQVGAWIVLGSRELSGRGDTR